MSKLLLIFVLFVSFAVYADEPTTVVRHRGIVGERIESKGKAAKENQVRVRVNRIIDGVVVQDRVALKGSDVFDAKPQKERKERVKERPLPKSKQPKTDDIVVKVKGKVK